MFAQGISLSARDAHNILIPDVPSAPRGRRQPQRVAEPGVGQQRRVTLGIGLSLSGPLLQMLET